MNDKVGVQNKVYRWIFKKSKLESLSPFVWMARVVRVVLRLLCSSGD